MFHGFQNKIILYVNWIPKVRELRKIMDNNNKFLSRIKSIKLAFTYHPNNTVLNICAQSSQTRLFEGQHLNNSLAYRCFFRVTL